MDRLLSWWKGARIEPGTRAPLPLDRKVGEFRLGEVLGDGGTATVYAAVDDQDRTAAVKIPHLGPLAEREFVATFRREAELGVSLRHPSIVKVLKAGTYAAPGHPEVPYFAMELLQGRDLRSVLQQDGPLEPVQAAAIARAIADALDWAHHRGVTHRDISPSNVFLTQGRAVKVMDFGISGIAERGGPARGLARGTPEYLAPERIADWRRADPGIDLYALGCVLFEMLTGHPPFRSDKPEEVLRMHQHDPVPAIPGLPTGLERVLHRLLEKDPGRRYGSAREVLVDLADLVPGV